MRWTSKRKHNIGDIVIKKKFAFLPVRIRHTMIWLEFYNCFYTYDKSEKLRPYKCELLVGGK